MLLLLDSFPVMCRCLLRFPFKHFPSLFSTLSSLTLSYSFTLILLCLSSFFCHQVTINVFLSLLSHFIDVFVSSSHMWISDCSLNPWILSELIAYFDFFKEHSSLFVHELDFWPYHDAYSVSYELTNVIILFFKGSLKVFVGFSIFVDFWFLFAAIF